MRRRRAVVVAWMGIALGAAPAAPRSAEANDQEPYPSLALSIAVAEVDGAPVQDDTWLAAQVASSNRLFGVWGVTFDIVEMRSLESRFAKLETRADRDGLAEHRKPHVINVFVVQTLRDVDDPSRYRMGVHWRKLTDLTQNYVIVAASALPTTLAHELGHYFGNGHQAVVNNLMSYERDDGEVFLDAAQGAIIRRHAQTFLATQKLWPAERVRSAADRQSIGRDGGGT